MTPPGAGFLWTRRSCHLKVPLVSGKKNRERPAAHPRRARAERRRKVSIRTESGRDPGSTMASARELPPLARLVHALRAEKIRFQIVPRRREAGEEVAMAGNHRQRAAAGAHLAEQEVRWTPQRPGPLAPFGPDYQTAATPRPKKGATKAVVDPQQFQKDCAR